MSAFLQEDLRFLVGLDRHSLEPPPKLSSKSGRELSGRLVDGILIEAPAEVSSLAGRSIDWRFSLKQKPGDVFYQFAKVDDEHEEILADSWKRVARKGTTPNRRMFLNMKLTETGFVNLRLILSAKDQNRIAHPLDPIDLHDLSGIEGDVFFGLDFGTDNTEAAYVNVTDPSLFESLPQDYRWQPQIEDVARQLQTQANQLLNGYDNRREVIEKLNERTVDEYVYHSNRIEGSLLNRGETASVLTAAKNTEMEGGAALRAAAQKLGAIDEAGEILPIGRLVSDRVAAINLRDAFRYVELLARDENPSITPFDLKGLHALVMKGSDEHRPGQYRNHPVTISQTTFVPPDFTQVEPFVETMFARLSTPEFNIATYSYQGDRSACSIRFDPSL